MPQCDECETECKRTFKPVGGLELCESCHKTWQKEHRLTRPSKPDQNQPFTELPSVSEVIQGAKHRKDEGVPEFLDKLSLPDLQEEISYAIAVLQAASSIYGQKCIIESLKRKAEIQEQFLAIKRKWRDQQAQKEREKRIKSLKGSDRKLYEITGHFLNEMVAEFTEQLQSIHKIAEEGLKK